MKKKLLLLTCILTNIAFSQDTESITLSTDSLFNTSLEDLMNTTIVSASKTKESIFDAPLTSCVITRQEIINMGATSIPDALRFCPALIVREVANGSYDVSIRGGIDGAPSFQYQNTNNTILAMIDNRPVFSNFQGGTFWQNLPVEVSDVERIEVVYGPNSPMYGPNAVSGVINIITRKEFGSKDVKVNANIQNGSSSIYSAYIGYKISDKLEISASANTSTKNRTHVDYYDGRLDKYTTNVDDVTPTASVTLPLSSVGSRKTGTNFNLYYSPKQKVLINYNNSFNTNQAFYMLATSYALNVASNRSTSNMIKAEIYNFTLQSSLLSGTQGLVGNELEYSHDYTNQDNYLDYTFKLLDKKLNIRPAVSFQYSNVNDRKNTVDVNKRGVFNSNASINNLAGSLKFDYKPIKWLRLIVATRVDKFSKPDKIYPSFQSSLNIKPAENHIFRLSAGRSFNGSFITQTYSDFIGFSGVIGQDTTSIPNVGKFPYTTNYTLLIQGGLTRNLLQNDVFEIGYRGQLSSNIQVDINLFNQTFSNISTFVNGVPNTQIVPYPNLPFPLPAQINVSQKSVVKNLDTKIKQNGVTFSATLASTNKKFVFKPHFTVQETRLLNNQVYYYDEGANNPRVPNGSTPLDLAIKTNEIGKGTPATFGGFTLNVVPINKLNLGISAYYFDKSYMTSILGQPSTLNGVIVPKSANNISEKAILNAHLNYRIHENVQIGFNARNLINNTSREAWGSDRIGAQYLGTLIIEY